MGRQATSVTMRPPVPGSKRSGHVWEGGPCDEAARTGAEPVMDRRGTHRLAMDNSHPKGIGTMVYVVNDPAEFAAQMQEGFCAAYPDWVRRVPGGVVRSTTVPEGQVAVVTGGGSGHYPAFAGLVGPGLAHGAALGNIFASPSAQQVYNVAKAAHNGGGVLFTYGNYAGDVLNFDQAQERLRAEGIPCETVEI